MPKRWANLRSNYFLFQLEKTQNRTKSRIRSDCAPGTTVFVASIDFLYRKTNSTFARCHLVSEVRPLTANRWRSSIFWSQCMNKELHSTELILRRLPWVEIQTHANANAPGESYAARKFLPALCTAPCTHACKCNISLNAVTSVPFIFSFSPVFFPFIL